MKRRLALSIVVLALIALLLWAWPRAPGERPVLAFAGPTMGTSYSVTVVEPPAGVGEEALRTAVEAALGEVNALMSTYDPDSELSRFNRHSSEVWFAISPATYAVLSAALELGAFSAGALDVTVGPLVNLWGFGPDGPVAEPPSEDAVERERERVGQGLLELRAEPPAVRKKHAGIYVDLSAIAKGYAVDQAGRALDSAGVENYLIEVGGEMLARGHNPGGGRWRVAVERPASGERAVQRVLEITDTAVATSGDYRNFFARDGTRYSHTIDPRSGRPVAHALASVTVLDDGAMRADALATALLVMGPEQGFEFARRHDLAALLIVRRGDEFVERESPRLSALLETGGNRS